MRSLTTEEIAKLKSKAKAIKSQIIDYKKKTFEDILVADLNLVVF
jgi:hypothetical protein